MKKSILLLSIFALCQFANAGTDSMAVFWKNGETIVLVNETGAESKLKQFIAQVGKGESFSLMSSSGDISIQCKVGSVAASCTFKFKNSAEVEFADNYNFAFSNSSNTTSFRITDLATSSFENAKNEKFTIWIDQFQVVAEVVK